MDLTKIVPPPKHPKYNGVSGDWELIERILEMRLPDDYKELIHAYGTGCFLNFLYPLSPFAPFDVSFNLLSGLTRQLLSAYEEGQREFPEFSPPFPPYPHKSGLFPWATTINGDTLFWLREGNPLDWTIVVCDSKFSKKYDHFKLNATGFLANLVSGKLKSKVFPRDILSEGAIFTPFSKKPAGDVEV